MFNFSKTYFIEENIMKILCVGDVCGHIGCSFAMQKLPELKRKYNVNVCIVNGENSADGNGITPQSADMLYAAGADVITGGNHSLRRKEIFSKMESDPFLLCPHNMSGEFAGRGYCEVDLGNTRLAVINLSGRVYLNDYTNPFTIADELIKRANTNGINVIIVDFHAEATAEKKALAYYLDGRVSAVFGTHTHVATADEQILPQKTAYITDIGMTGPVNSVLGVKKELSIAKIKDGLPVKFELENGNCRLDGCIIEIDYKNGKAINIERISVL